jgi:glutaconate CoA-transferase subunit A
MENKLTSMAEAVSSIPNGSHIALGGFAITRCVIAFVHEMIRQSKRDLVISQCIAGMDTDLLVGAGCVKHLIYGGGSLDRFGLHECINRAIDSKTITIEEYSSLSICFKFLAGSLGLPFLPIKSLIGSDIHQNLKKEAREMVVKEAICPFTGENLLYLRALNPDIAILHVNQSDEEGNAIIYGPTWDNPELAKASQRIILISEEIVPRGYLQKVAESVFVPAFRVEKVVHTPFGAHPTAVYRAYDFDADHLKYYAEQNKDEKKFKEYLDYYVLGVSDFWGYLERIGGLRKLWSLKADVALGY